MKTNKKNKLDVINIMLFTFIGLLTFMTIAASYQDDNKWEVPAAAKKMKNPTDPADKEGMAVGKSLYMKHCKSCHGKIGKGDGTKAEELDTPCGDFTIKEFQAQTDGEIFYKTKEGRDDMPTFKKKITDDEDIWLIVNYMRTFGEAK